MAALTDAEIEYRADSDPAWTRAFGVFLRDVLSLMNDPPIAYGSDYVYEERPPDPPEAVVLPLPCVPWHEVGGEGP